MKQATFRPASATDGPPSYRERSGQIVTVIDEVGAEADPDADSEDVSPMFRVRFEDGTETEAFADELEPDDPEASATDELEAPAIDEEERRSGGE